MIANHPHPRKELDSDEGKRAYWNLAGIASSGMLILGATADVLWMVAKSPGDPNRDQCPGGICSYVCLCSKSSAVKGGGGVGCRPQASVKLRRPQPCTRT